MKFIKIRKPLNNFAETLHPNEVLKHTETPQKKETPQLNEVLKVFFKKWKRLKKTETLQKISTIITSNKYTKIYDFTIYN